MLTLNIKFSDVNTVPNIGSITVKQIEATTMTIHMLKTNDIVQRVKHEFGIHRWMLQFYSPKATSQGPYKHYRCAYCDGEMSRNIATGEKTYYIDVTK